MSEENDNQAGDHGDKRPKHEQLPGSVQKFIVELLACYESPSDVAKAVLHEFDLHVSKQQVEYYDATKRASAKGLSKKLTEHFRSVRKAYNQDHAANLGQLDYRNGIRSFMVRSALARGNFPLVDSLLVNAAKDQGGAFTNRRELTGKDGGAIRISDEDKRRELAGKMFEKLLADGKSKEEARTELMKLGVNVNDLPNN